MEIIKSILFVCSALTLSISFLFIQKSKRTLRFMNWFIMTIPLIMCYFTTIQAFFKILSLPFSIIYFTIVNCLLSAYFIYQIFYKKRVQKYDIKLIDFMVLGSLLIFTLIIFFIQFSFNLDIVYQTSDPGVHYGLAMDAIRTGKTTGMFFSETNNALMISVFLPFLKSQFYAYKLFILCDGFMYFLSGAVFLVLINIFSEKKILHKIILFVFTMLYILAYPLTNMIFGFNYLGMSVTLIALLLFILNQFRENILYKSFTVIALAMSCLSLAVCYMLFAPIIWIAVLCNIAIYFYKNEKLFTKEFILFCLAVFLIPSILTLKFCYFDYFNSRGLDVAETINYEGGIYKNLFMNFIIYIPLFIYSIVDMIKNKKFHIYNVFFILYTLFYIILFILMYRGFVSEYYFFKIYFPLWLLFMIIVCRGASLAINNNYSTFLSLSSIIPVICIFSIFGSTRYDMKSDAIQLFNIYDYNRDKLTNKRIYWPDLLALYQYAIDNLEPKTDNVIPFFIGPDNCEHQYWFEALSGEDTSAYYTWFIGKDTFINKLEAKEFDYIIILNGDLLYQANETYFDQFEIVMENKDGKILKVN